MTTLTPAQRLGAADRLFAIAVEQVQALIERLNDLIHRIEAGEVPPPGEVKKTVSDYRGVIDTAIKERQRLEDLLHGDTGIGPDAPLDFEAARDEIGGRLARLRAARDGGAVPDGA